MGPSPDEIISPFILAFDPIPAISRQGKQPAGEENKAATAKLRGQGSSMMDKKENVDLVVTK